MIEAENLKSIAGIRHGFFTREGGNSKGLYASLNTGLGSQDNRETVRANREVIRAQIEARALVTPYQHHGDRAETVCQAWPDDQPPKADAVVTEREGLAVAVNTADCTPVLFASGDGAVVGAAHAGWKGAIGGILESTVAALEAAGGQHIHAAIGPTISASAYEVGPEFIDNFLSEDTSNQRFFTASTRPGHHMFDLPAYVEMRLGRLKLASIENLAICTYSDEARFFSYRRSCHRGEVDYGRQLSAIVKLSK